MANPVGEDNWLAYIEEETRRCTDLEGRVKVVELFKKGIGAEPSSLKIWLAYCEYFWSLFVDCQGREAGWSNEDRQLGRELFSFDSALSLWSEGYEAIKFRLNDSHEFWNRWVSIEQEQLARTRTPVGVKRISHLFRDRLQVPHATWDNTSQMFSSFLSTYNNTAYETEFKEVTAAAQPAKEAYDERERRELELNKFARAQDERAYKAAMRDYLDWEMAQTTRPHLKNPALTVTLALALYSRALTDVFAFDDETWSKYVVFLSALRDSPRVSQFQYVLPDTLNVLQRATSHCPWSGSLWSRYFLSAEEAGWAFHDVEHIKHAATNSKTLDKNGMTSVIDMYAAWCGYLKRNAMRPNATDDAVDVADVGLVSALEDVKMWGERLYKDEYRGDPNYRLERIVIQYLTEKKGEVEEARRHWKRMADQPLLKGSYDFWLNYYLWEMMVYASQPRQRSPTPATSTNGSKPVRVPSVATNVLLRALQQDVLDWPERVMDVCQQHCNDYEQPETLRRALDTIHKGRRRVEKRRARERAEAEAAYTVQAQATQQPAATDAEAVAAADAIMHESSPSNPKRKRADTLEESTYDANKRPRNNEVNGADATANEQSLKRDRENTSVMVRNLPSDVTLTAVRKYFKEYGHILNATIKQEEDGSSASALVEFESHEEMQSALLRDQKYFSDSQISVQPGTGLTIYVTNYPPTADEEYIRNLFKDCGDVFSIRFPSLKYNTHRRFCYVSFKDPQAAAKATKLEGKLLDGRYKLEAKYSDPGSKKKRQGAVAEGRELRIRNVDAKTTEKDLRDVFGKYGQVESVKLLKDLKGKNRGTAFAVMETKEQAESAMALGKTKLGSNIVEVELSKETNYKPTASSKAEPTPAASHADADVTMAGDDTTAANKDRTTPSEIRARTMAIMDLPDTVNDARVRAIAEKHGEIVKVVLRPHQQGAIVEYADVAAAGRSMMSLNGAEIAPGKKVRTGTVDEMFKEKAAAKSAAKFMQPTQIVRRPAMGGQKPKQRAGFVAVASASEGDKKAEDVNGTGSSAKPKSNADFKALFLGSKKQ
jgi:squamous cell carcinoma antigen recognized by T-cells 3